MAKMDFAVFDECSYNWFDSVPEAVDSYEQSFREVQLEERLGFKYHFVIEHQGHMVGQIQTPTVYLAALAHHTSTIRIGAMVFLLPFYNPLRLAMETAMVDQLSRGRLEFGCGVGGSGDSFKSWNLPYAGPARRGEGLEALDIIMKARTQDKFTHHGEWWDVDDAIPLPKPYQKPHPPIWYAGRSKTSMELCVARKYGVGLFLDPDPDIADILNGWKRMWKDSGHKDPSPPSFLTRPVYVAETDEQAYEEASLYLPQAYTWGEDKFPVPKIGTQVIQEEDSELYRRGRAMFAGMKTGVDFWTEHGLAHVGSPETITRRLEKQQELCGFDVFGARFRMGPMSNELVEKSITLFGEKVMPAFS